MDGEREEKNHIILYKHIKPSWKLTVFFSGKLFFSHKLLQIVQPLAANRKLPFSPFPAHKCRQFIAGTHLQENAGFIEAKCREFFVVDTCRAFSAFALQKSKQRSWKNKQSNNNTSKVYQTHFTLPFVNTDANNPFGNIFLLLIITLQC